MVCAHAAQLADMSDHQPAIAEARRLHLLWRCHACRCMWQQVTTTRVLPEYTAYQLECWIVHSWLQPGKLATQYIAACMLFVLIGTDGHHNHR